MTTVYKLVREDLTTYNNFQWTIGVPSPSLPGGGICSENVYHAYSHPLLAALFAPIHVDDTYSRLFEAEGVVCVLDATKVGCTTITLLTEVPLPPITLEQRIKIAILAEEKALARAWTTTATARAIDLVAVIKTVVFDDNANR